MRRRSNTSICKKDVREYLGKLRDDNKDFKTQIDSLKPGQRIDGNVMETLTAAIKESVKDSNEDKKYYFRQAPESKRHGNVFYSATGKVYRSFQKFKREREKRRRRLNSGFS